MNNIRELRQSRGMTMKELGERINVAESTISLYETGKRQPDISTLRMLSAILGASVDYIVGIDTESAELSKARSITSYLLKNTTLTKEEIENKTNTNYQTLESWCQGLGDYFNDKLYLLADCFDVSIDYLLGRSDNPHPIDEQLEGELFALYGEIHDLTDEEKAKILEFIKFTKSQRKE